eukprot:Skav225765  [mRNA]  locus=scaffold3552:228637:231351:- [translate_table: standard]
MLRSAAWAAALALLDGTDVVGCSAAISACGRAGQWQWAMALLEDAHRGRLGPDAVTYNAVLSALAYASGAANVTGKGADVGRADGYGRVAHVTGLAQSAQWRRAIHELSQAEWPWVLAILAVTRCTSQEYCLHFLRRMWARFPDAIYSVASAISACGFAQRWQQALQIFGQQMEIDRSCIHSSAFPGAILNSTVWACEKAFQWQQCLSLMKETGQGDASTASIASHLACASALQQANRWEDALKRLVEFDMLAQAPQVRAGPKWFVSCSTIEESLPNRGLSLPGLQFLTLGH